MGEMPDAGNGSDDTLPTAINPFYDLHRYYIRLIINFNVYYFAIGGILLTFLANGSDAAYGYKIFQPLLLVPIVLSGVQCIVYERSKNLAAEIYNEKMAYLRKIAGKDFNKYNFDPLLAILNSFTVIHLLLFFGLSREAYLLDPEQFKGTTKNTGLPWKHRLRLMSWPASALANGRGNTDFSWCPEVPR